MMTPELRKEVNQQFICKVHYEGEIRPRLVGAGMLYKHIGSKRAKDYAETALSAGLYKYTKKIRTGATIKFFENFDEGQLVIKKLVVSVNVIFHSH